MKEVLGEKHSELKLIMLCLTRWIEKIDSMHRFREVFEPVIKTFDIRPMPEKRGTTTPVSMLRDFTTHAQILNL